MRSKILAFGLAASLVCLSVPPSHAAADTELLELKNTILNLVDELVNQGVITADAAESMKTRAALKAREQAAQQAIAAGETEDIPPAADAAAGAAASVVRVPYVPEFVRDEIRAEVREELRQDVTDDVVAVAREEKWGTPDALPQWLNRISFTGDFRVRTATALLDENNNPTVPFFQSINEAGGAAAAGENVFLNTTDSFTRLQLRARLAAVFTMTDNVRAVMRLATGNDIIPTTRNQTYGNYAAPFDIFLEQAYFEWASAQMWEDHELMLRVGRVPQTFLYTPLVFDDDFYFDGLGMNYRGEVFGEDRALLLNLGAFTLLSERPNNILGGTDSKYWFGGQLGIDFGFTETLRLLVAGAYYDFQDVVGQRNEFNSTAKDWTAPGFIAKGNTVFDIRNDNDPDTQLFALASEFRLVNALFALSYSGFAPIQVTLRGDYVQNIGFDENDVAARVGTAVEERNTGWKGQLEVGWPRPADFGQWQAFVAYRHLERDAVIDGLTDSNFHGGGTDAEGYILGFLFGLTEDTWLRARYFAADEIDGAPAGFAEPFDPLAIDIFQLSLNARF
jgi:hypothetical protein